MADQDGSGEGKRYYQQPMETEELASKMVFIQNKRFYLDVKQNRRGRFIKIAEVTPGGNKNRLTLSMPIANEFRNILGDFIEHYATLGPTNPEAPPDERRHSLKSERITRENKRYFLDLKENDRGRFLRVRQQQAFNSYNQDGRPINPPQIALPAQGMVEFRDALTGLIDEYGQDVADQLELPQSHVIGTRRSKQFFCDVGRNQRGVFLRVTEQTRYYRSAITVPEKYWKEFANIFKEKGDEIQEYNQQIDKTKPEDGDIAEIGDGVSNMKLEESNGELRDGEGDERRRTSDYDEEAIENGSGSANGGKSSDVDAPSGSTPVAVNNVDVKAAAE